MSGRARVLIIGGSKNYAGALYLAGVSALRAGAESVIVMAPEKVAWALNALSPDLVTRKLTGEYLLMRHKSAIERQLKTADVLLLGNGATTKPGPALLMRRLMRWPGPKVVDADAVKVLRKNAVENAILTPNEGEWKLLVAQNDIRKLLRQKVVVIKKSARTEIISATRHWRMRRTNPGLAKAGMGDVLAGLCAGFLATDIAHMRAHTLWKTLVLYTGVLDQRLWHAARKAVEVGSKAADMLAKRKKGYVFLASDLVGELRRLEKTQRGK